MDKLINSKINLVTILKRIGAIKTYVSRACYYECQCDCGKIFNVRRQELLKGKIISCGCYGKHGYSNKGNKEYETWLNIKSRCNIVSNPAYKNYGGRGIKLCIEWENSFEQFLKDMGKSPKKYSIERIDNNKGYSKDNCIWASRKTQSVNKRTSIKIEFNGIKTPLVDVAKKMNIKYATLLYRYKKYGDNCLIKNNFILNVDNGIFYSNISDAAKSIGKNRDSIKYLINKTGQYQSLKIV
jgi:hypothetical protein